MSRKIIYPAADRNKNPILNVLKTYFAPNAETVLEISSGTGQHCSYFAEHFPHIKFQPSELDRSLLDSIDAYGQDTRTKNVLPALPYDVTLPFPNGSRYDYIININMIHYTPWKCTEGLFSNAAAILKPFGLMFTYGPYAYKGVIAPQSNIDFDKILKLRNPELGLKDVIDLETLGNKYGFTLLKMYDLPANNKCLVWSLR